MICFIDIFQVGAGKDRKMGEKKMENQWVLTQDSSYPNNPSQSLVTKIIKLVSQMLQVWQGLVISGAVGWAVWKAGKHSWPVTMTFAESPTGESVYLCNTFVSSFSLKWIYECVKTFDHPDPFLDWDNLSRKCVWAREIQSTPSRGQLLYIWEHFYVC